MLALPGAESFSDAPRRRIALIALLLLAVATSAAQAQDEFLLNDDRLNRNQWEPVVARGATGTVVVAWQDGRNGIGSFEDYDIYALTIRNAFALGTSVNRRISDGPAGQLQADPDIAASRTGTYFCVWVDSRLGNRDIYGVALDSLGLPLSPNLLVSDDVGTTEQFAPRVVPVGSDRYLVVWGDGRDGLGEIFGSYRTASGAPIGGNVRISSDPAPGGSFQGDPGVGSAPDGGTLVVWSDGRNGPTYGSTFDIYGQWMDGTGAPIGGNFKINDATGTQNATAPAVAASADGFVVTWIDRRRPGDPGDVWAQRYAPDGTPAGANIRVNDDPAGAEQRFVRACDDTNGAMVFWEDLRGGLGLDSNVEGALVPWTSDPAGANFRVNDVAAGRQGNPAAVWDGVEAAIVVWEDLRRGSSDIFSAAVYPDGTLRGGDAQLNDDAAPFDQRHPRLGSGTGRYLATWLDLRGSGSDLYGQWITAAGARDGPNQLLWDDNFTERPVAAASAVGPTHVALVATQVTRDSDAGEIRGFLLAAIGQGPSSSFWISELLPSAQASPSVAASVDGFGVAWLDSREGDVRLYGQRLGLDGSRLGGNHPVLSIEPADPIYAFRLASKPGGGYWLLYSEGATADQRLWLVSLDADLLADGLQSKVGAVVPGAKGLPSLDVAPNGRIETVWLGDGSTGVGQVYFQAFDSAASPPSPLAPPLPLSVTGAVATEAVPTVASMGEFSVVTWAARPFGDWGIWMQRIQDGVIPLGPAVHVDQDIQNSDQLDPSVGVDAAGDVLMIWSDSRSASSGTDILGRVLRFATTAASDPPPDPPPAPPPAPPTSLRVGRARPNPFVASTGVPLDIPEGAAGHIRVIVVNARGIPVRVLHDGPIPVAASTLRWDGRDQVGRPVPSGVYWIEVRGGGERHALRVVRLR